MIRPPTIRDAEEYHLGALSRVARRKGNPELQALLKEYAAGMGLPPVQQTPVVPWDEGRCRAIAREFEALDFRDDSDLAREAYDALADEIGLQYDLLSGYFDIDFYGDGDPLPYLDSADMMEDVRKNHHLWVYTGGAPHALLSNEDNLKFRAVHDLFGHAAQGFSFGPIGEENAWLEHSKILSPLARAAFTTETRGSNSWFNCGPHSHLPVKERPYAEQKGALLPSDRWAHPVLEEAYQEWPEFLFV